MSNPLYPPARIWTWIGLASYWLALFAATHVPQPLVEPVTATVPDKLPHVLAFAGLAVLLAAACRVVVGRLSGRFLCLVWVLAVLYGAIDEWTQIPVGRQASVWDWLADAVGATAGIVVFSWYHRRRRQADSANSAKRTESP
jgi:VanZ family protein